MQTVNIHEAKTHLSRLLEAVERGEEVIIARAGQPIATLNGLQAAGQHGRADLDVRRLRRTAR